MRFALLFLAFVLTGCEQAPVAKSEPTGSKSAHTYVMQDFEPDFAKQLYASADDVAELHEKAKAACLCERSGQGSEGECWSDFWKQSNTYKSSGEWASACAAGSSAGIDYDKNPDKADRIKVDRTVITDWPYGACSADEVPAKKAAYEAKSNMRGC